MDIDNLCINCFEELTNGNVCEKCGYDNDTVVDIIYLQPKTTINDRYVIGSLVAHESDAAVYMAYDKNTQEVVTVREFLPRNIANRLEGNLDIHIRERNRDSFGELKASFIKLWNTMASLNNLAAVIPTTDVFELNGTAYAVSKFFDSISLREFLLRNPDGNIDWEQARIMFMPILTTLEAIHANGIIHGGICPDNLVLCRDGKVRLKGFCISEANTFSSELEFNVNDGYTALEQYDNKHKMGTATDIYAFAACIFRALVGQNPPDAKSREANDRLMIPNTIAEKIPTYVIRALGGALQIYPDKRTNDVNTLRDLLNAAPNVVAASSQEATSGTVVNNQSKGQMSGQLVEEEYSRDYAKMMEDDEGGSKKSSIVIILVLLIAIACAGGYFISQNDSLFKKEEPTTQSVSVESYVVPDFCKAGYSQSDIENNGAWNKQFKITFDPQFSTDTEEGIIFEQSIRAGESVDEGTELVLTVSKGVETAEIPNVGGLPLEEATKLLTAAGFKVSSVEVYNNNGSSPNTVKTNGMAPKAGSVCAVGEEVILQVYGEVVTTTEAPEQDDAE